VALVEREGVAVAAVMVVNAVGDVRDPDTGRLLAGTREAPDSRRLLDTARALAAGERLGGFAPTHPTIGALVTTARLDKAGPPRGPAGVSKATLGRCRRRTWPRTGNALFRLSVGAVEADPDTLGEGAASAVARIARGVLATTGLPRLPTARDLAP
jgi:L-aminopeptidase/D-esterase-like protein